MAKADVYISTALGLPGAFLKEEYEVGPPAGRASSFPSRRRRTCRVRLCRFQTAMFWPSHGRREAEHPWAFVAASSLVSVWCVWAFTYGEQHDK